MRCVSTCFVGFFVNSDWRSSVTQTTIESKFHSSVAAYPLNYILLVEAEGQYFMCTDVKFNSTYFNRSFHCTIYTI